MFRQKNLKNFWLTYVKNKGVVIMIFDKINTILGMIKIKLLSIFCGKKIKIGKNWKTLLTIKNSNGIIYELSQDDDS